ncbi:NAD(P)H-dependent glycerol-3-phosphate dehydrogenase [Candidatus Mycoplasma mahonii]|uniref:NAD(P)H-dependent glycerol-3-phosphate dehydrogenase n=1 Tax=Candidatus Mycoplasma mahonii TaxID=3004105 RepID=UPI0026ED6618|nr:NAD(P)H-dependent glycerol-3-phosphate dehydrogenase [Candidatus Mycoplasma mahonii]WKX02619.1 NAD(P)H-dependent glycerol-3-phosphate dehydrogenase [Candidatus Mycoplasma mahonii]
MTKEKITIIGSGALGTSLGKVLFDGGSENIVFYGLNKKELFDLSNGSNIKYFPDSIKLPKFKTTTSLKDAIDGAKYVLIAVPSSAMSIVYPQIIENISSEVLIICGSKGFFPGTKKSLHKGMKELSKRNKNIRGVVSLIGPSHAEEIVKEVPTSIAAVSRSDQNNIEVQNLFSNRYMRIYTQRDVKGAEVGAAYKNVIAIASGIINGLGLGINYSAALLTRGMKEMSVFNKFHKGKRETIMGLTGLGDLIVTATSELSRNFTFGKELITIGKQKALASKATIEGLFALDIIYLIGQENGLDLPIVYALHDIIRGKDEPEFFYVKLSNRKLEAE